MTQTRADEHGLAQITLQLDHTTQDLARTLGHRFSLETIRHVVDETYHGLAATARLHTYLPLLTYRLAKDRLTTLPSGHDTTLPTTPQILFVCRHHTGRSPMAAALLNHYATGRVTATSAGTAPADTLNPAVVEAMAELGLDLSRHQPRPLTDDTVRAADIIITLGGGDPCPVYPGKHYCHWELDDPTGKNTEDVRALRDDLTHRITNLLTDLITPPPPPRAKGN